MHRLWLFWIYCVLYMNIYRHVMAASVNMPGNEENCVLSFVIPRDKMKSSCDHEEKVNRHISAMETKVNLYKQQVMELQMQLDKMRQLNNERYDKLERQVTTVHGSTDRHFFLEHRLNSLEREFQKLNSVTNMLGRRWPLPEDDQMTSSESHLSVLPQNIKTVIQSEVQVFADEFTNKFRTYILEQIMVYNNVFRNLPTDNGEPGQVRRNLAQSESKISSIKDNAETIEHVKRLLERNERLTGKYQQVKTTWNDAGHQRLSDDSVSMNEISISESRNATGSDRKQSSSVPRYKRHHVIRNSQLEDVEEIPENNESFSGDQPDMDESSLDDPLTATEPGGSSSTSSRMTQTSEPSVNSTDTQPGNNGEEKEWKIDWILEQCYNYTKHEMERKLKNDITNIIYSPLAEIVRLVETQKYEVQEQILNQDNKFEQLNKQVTVHIRELENNVLAANVNVRDVSQAMQESLIKLDAVKLLEEVVSDLINNVTSTNSREQSDLEKDEQNKRIKKLERLIGVYQQSLQHYRNETKHEYREMRVSLEKETSALRIFTKGLQNHLNETMSAETTALNNSFSKKLQAINEQIRQHEDTLMRVQMEIVNAQNVLESKTKRSHRDYDNMLDTVNQITVKQKDISKKLENIEQAQSTLMDKINVFAKDISSLQMETRLSVDEWLPLTFEFDSSRTDCFGDQYVKRSGYPKVKFVGVVVCSPTRYKIFLSSSLNSTFRNIGDANGMGDDHCEFVGAAKDAPVKISPFKVTFGSVQGYTRSHWGQEPTVAYLNAIKPSPHWYECGVKIP